MIDTKIIFLAQLQAKLWPFKDLGVPPGGQISNPRKIQNTRRRAKKFGIFAYLHLGYLYTKNEKNLFFWVLKFCWFVLKGPMYELDNITQQKWLTAWRTRNEIFFGIHYVMLQSKCPKYGFSNLSAWFACKCDLLTKCSSFRSPPIRSCRFFISSIP